MGVRRELLIHRKKTIESFRLVRADISGINAHIESIRNTLASFESRTSAIDIEIANLRKLIDRCLSDINIHEANNLNLLSKVENVGKSAENAVTALASFKNSVNNVASKNLALSRNVSAQSKLVKELAPRTKKQSLAIRHLLSASRISQDEIKKAKNMLNRRFRTAKRADSELEKKIKSQRRRISQLNRKIEGKKAIKIKSAKRKIIPKKITKKTITPKKTVTEVITPTKKTITEVKK